MRLTILVMLGATLAAGGCNTTDALSTVDTTKTSSVTQDIAQRDLDAGQKHFRAANYGLAEKHFRKAVELNAANAEGWLGLAASYDQLGRFDFADRAYEQLVGLIGRKPEVVSNQGYSQLLRGNHAKARKLLNEARRLLPDDARVTANLALLDQLS